MDNFSGASGSFNTAWQKLEKHFQEISDAHMCDLFRKDHERTDDFTLKLNDITVDYSKHRITRKTLDLLLSLATESGIQDAIDALFTGQKVNTTEQRSALHTALRTPAEQPVYIDDENISLQVHHALKHIGTFVEKLRAGVLKGSTGKSIDTLVNLGIGGSYLGPNLAIEALMPYSDLLIKIHFVANIDPAVIEHVLSESDPETTLFCLSSKSFTTNETLTNALTAKQWLESRGCHDISRHFIAVSANKTAAEDFGIRPDYFFPIWDWVGGRYSLWSSIGLPVAVSIGMDNFLELLAGARDMDEHFLSSPLESNIPVILGMLDIWYINFFNTETQAIIPYDNSLSLLPDYLSQLVMESNGKNIDRNGAEVGYKTAPIIWGGVGTNVQHAFFQLLHQGTRLVPVDFLAVINSQTSNVEQQKLLLANCLAQSEALMMGNLNECSDIKPYQRIYGNKPSTTILCKELNPRVLGSLLALYEHRTYVQGHLWNINSFDQWGVELGKKLASTITEELNGKEIDSEHDASTKKLILTCISSK